MMCRAYHTVPLGIKRQKKNNIKLANKNEQTNETHNIHEKKKKGGSGGVDNVCDILRWNEARYLSVKCNCDNRVFFLNSRCELFQKRKRKKENTHMMNKIPEKMNKASFLSKKKKTTKKKEKLNRLNWMCAYTSCRKRKKKKKKKHIPVHISERKK